MLRFLLFLLFVCGAAGAFYGGMRFEKAHPGSLDYATAAQPSPATPEADRSLGFERKRAAVDSDPQKWISENLPLEFAKEGITKAIDSKDPEFLYLYGRALMRSGNDRDALQAFERAVVNLRAEPKSVLSLGDEVKLAEASAALRSSNQSPGKSQESLMAEQTAARIIDEMLNLKREGPAR